MQMRTTSRLAFGLVGAGLALTGTILLLKAAWGAIAVSLGLSSILFLMMFGHDASLASVAQTLFSAFEGHYTLLAIPFFILASVFMSTGGVANRIIRFAIAVVGSFRGGLAIASVFACMLFAALSGSSPATVVAIGSIVIAGMISVGYSREFAAGVICNAGTLGILIPPSILAILFAVVAQQSVGELFVGAVIPGLILSGLYILFVIAYTTVKPEAGPPLPVEERLARLARAIPAHLPESERLSDGATTVTSPILISSL